MKTESELIEMKRLIDLMPASLILRNDRHGKHGESLEKVRESFCGAYYCKFDGSSSLIRHVYAHDIETILQGNHFSYFTDHVALTASSKRNVLSLVKDLDEPNNSAT